MTTITWSEIEAEANASGFRERLVEVYRRYEGMETDERTAQGRIVKVTASSFARHMGIDERTFQDWVVGAAAASTTRERDRTREDLRRATPERKAEIARDLISDPVIADAIIADPETQEVVLKAYNRSSQSQQFRKDQDRHAKEQEARKADTKRTLNGLGGLRAMAAMWEVDSTFTMDGYARTEEGIETARLFAQWLRNIAARLEAWAGGVFEPMSDADFDAGIEAITKSSS